MPTQAVRVFISYSHDSFQHSERVLELSNLLRSEGVDAWIDRYESDPAEGWPRWMQRQVEHAAFVICVCTPVYRRRFEGKEELGKGNGVTWEGLIANQLLYSAGTRNTRIIPLLFDGQDEGAIPEVLRPYTYYCIPRDYEGLYRRLTGQPAVTAPPLGPLRILQPHGRTPTATGLGGSAVHIPGIGPIAPQSEGLPAEAEFATVGTTLSEVTLRHNSHRRNKFPGDTYYRVRVWLHAPTEFLNQVAKVVYERHPTFKNRYKEVASGPDFADIFSCWDSFTVKATIHLFDGKTIERHCYILLKE